MQAVRCAFLIMTALSLASAFANGPARSLLHHRPAHGSLQPLQSTLTLRGGALSAASFKAAQAAVTATPTSFFNALFLALLAGVVAIKGQGIASALAASRSGTQQAAAKPAGVKSLQARFLVVFWLMRMADWLQGPYFYEVYSSKVIGGLPVSLDMVSKLFLVGFASTGLFGPWVGRMVDAVGRKAGTLAFAALYTVGALSTRSSLLPLLLLGRVAGGVGTSLLFSAPEAWVVGEHTREKHSGADIGETFGLAYAGDALVAIAAGQLASLTAAKVGPTGPFTASVGFLALGSVMAAMLWGENVAPASAAAAAATSGTGKDAKPTIRQALELMAADKRILLVGAMQALFEGSMYIFVLQWCPSIKRAIEQSALWGGAGAATAAAAAAKASAAVIPFGKIFSCFMASCLLGTTAFAAIQKRGVRVETSAAVMMTTATAALAAAALTASSAATSLPTLVAAFLAFEACVGMYFPSIGTLRSKYLPDSHRSVMMNLFGIPLNLIVVGVFLSIKSLGVGGALGCATVALGGASVCAVALARL